MCWGFPWSEMQWFQNTYIAAWLLTFQQHQVAIESKDEAPLLIGLERG